MIVMKALNYTNIKIPSNVSTMQGVVVGEWGMRTYGNLIVWGDLNDSIVESIQKVGLGVGNILEFGSRIISRSNNGAFIVS